MVAGVILIAGALVLRVTDTPTCRGVALTPDQVCRTADGTEYETYDQSIAKTKTGTAIAATVGVIVIAFGGLLVVGERRRHSSAG